MNQATAFDPYAMPADALREPPASLWSALMQIGPGIILAGSIIGTGELLVTTGLGADYGFVLLWLILFSCVIKVFVQIELGRYAISSGKPTLGALDELPGPRFGTHWLVWWWLFMLLATVSQLGGMVGGVGQALHLLWPRVSENIAAGAALVSPWLADAIRQRPGDPWAVLTFLVAVGLLLSGGYRRIELLTTFLVAGVTLTTVACVVALPFNGFPIHFADVRQGLAFGLPPAAGITAAFSAFGITGVGASELYSYPYWCLEKGYARFTGPSTSDDAWVRRARGWMRVLQLDAWVSMIVFTVATVAFYFMGAVVLHRLGLHPGKQHMMEQLAQMYVKAFGHPWTKALFLIGGSVVLFKTLYVSAAGQSRLTSDFLSLAGLVHYAEARQRAKWIRFFCLFYPALALFLYMVFGDDPSAMVIFGGFAQGVTLPVITAATIYLRFRRIDPRLAPSLWVDGCLWLAFFTMTGGAIYSVGKMLPWPARSNGAVAALQDGRHGEPGRWAPPPRNEAVWDDEAVWASALETACRETAAQMAERLGDGCATLVRAPFVVAGDLDEAELDRWHAETIAPAARAMARAYFTTPPHEPITILLFSGKASYQRQARSLYGDLRVSVYGYYKPHLRTLVMNISTGGGTLVHELTHALIDFDFPDAPDWFNEALASLHEQCRIRRDESGIDGLVNWRLPGLQKTIRAGRLHPLEAMIRDDDFRGSEVGLNYAHARYFCLYLQSDQNPRGRDVLAEFYDDLRRHQRDDPRGLGVVRRIFPDISWAQLDRAFRDFALALGP